MNKKLLVSFIANLFFLSTASAAGPFYFEDGQGGNVELSELTGTTPRAIDAQTASLFSPDRNGTPLTNSALLILSNLDVKATLRDGKIRVTEDLLKEAERVPYYLPEEQLKARKAMLRAEIIDELEWAKSMSVVDYLKANLMGRPPCGNLTLARIISGLVRFETLTEKSGKTGLKYLSLKPGANLIYGLCSEGHLERPRDLVGAVKFLFKIERYRDLTSSEKAGYGEDHYHSEIHEARTRVVVANVLAPYFAGNISWLEQQEIDFFAGEFDFDKVDPLTKYFLGPLGFIVFKILSPGN